VFRIDELFDSIQQGSHLKKLGQFERDLPFVMAGRSITVNLPITSDGIPDFDYMDAYIKAKLSQKIANKICAFNLKISAAKYIINKS
jgi:hypothetical protein